MELTIDEIKARYPDQWVLVGNPQVSIAAITAGVVIWHGKDKREMLQAGIDWKSRFESAMTFFTGERPKGRPLLVNFR